MFISLTPEGRESARAPDRVSAPRAADLALDHSCTHELGAVYDRAFYHTDPRWLVSGLEKQVAAAAFRTAANTAANQFATEN